ncbi:MAG: hypothetical protein Q4F13_00305 [Pseudomonadota bacterium]|nr:hypothetical protein [Pseudomonadota bacterium]
MMNSPLLRKKCRLFRPGGMLAARAAQDETRYFLRFAPAPDRRMAKHRQSFGKKGILYTLWRQIAAVP